jgi:hypothetical protein
LSSLAHHFAILLGLPASFFSDLLVAVAALLALLATAALALLIPKFAVHP